MAVMNPTELRIVALTWPEIKAILLARGVKKTIIARLDCGYFMNSIRNLPKAIQMVRLQKYKRTGKW